MSLVIGVLWLAGLGAAYAADSLSYSGRLVNSNGSPVVGSVNLKAELAYTNAPTVILCSDEIANVPLANGVFHIKLELDCTPSTLVSVLSNTPTNQSVAIRITDQSNSKVYSFQALHSIPFSLISEMSKQIVQMSATEGQILTWDDTAKKWVPRNPVGTGNGSVTSINTGAGLIGGPISVSGTIAIDVDGVTSAMIQEGTIVDGDISPTAAIAQSKIANLGTALGNKEDKLPTGGASTDYLDGTKAWQNFDQSVRGALLLGLGTGTAAPIAGTNNVLEALENLQAQILSNDTAFDGTGQWSKTGNKIFYNTDNVGIGTTNPNEKLDVTGNIALTGKVRFKDSGANYVELKAPVTIGSTVTFTLPGSLGTNGQVLRTDAFGNLSWVTISTDSSGIVDGSIVDADIAAGANIAQSKINGLSTTLTNLQNSITSLTTDNVAEGTTNLYFTEPKVLGTDLAGLNTTAGTVTAADTMLSSIGKLVGNIAAVSTAQSNYVLKAGGTMSGNLLMGGNNVTGLAAPLLDTDAATKLYVDTKAAEASKWTKNVNDIYYNTGNVGIGTTTPQSSLHVASGQIQIPFGTATTPAIAFAGDTDTGIFAQWADEMSLAVNGVEKLRVNGGNTIFYDNPVVSKATVPMWRTIRTGAITNGTVVGGLSFWWGSSISPNSAPKIEVTATENQSTAAEGRSMNFFTTPNGTTVAANRMTIDHDGDIGIGTTTPRSKLEVIGAIQIGADAVACNAIKAGAIRYNAGNVEYCNGGPSWQAFGVSGAGITNINGSTSGTQSFANGSSGLAPNWSTAAGVHTINIPFASAAGVTAGLISKTDYDAFNAKLGTASTFSGDVSGTYNSTSVDKIKGTLVAITTITSGNFLKYNGTNWINSMLAAADIPNLDTAKITTGVLPVARGGTNTGSLTGNRIMVSTPTAIVEAAALTNGQILIGSTGAAPIPATLTAGTGVTINNSAGGISISATGTGGTVTSVTGTAPIGVATGTTTPVVSISQANTTTNGYLSSTDWNTFNNKQASLSAGATINGIVYPATALQTMQIPQAPVNLTDAVNKQYVDTQVSSGANQWTLSSGNIYRASGNVGIGTSSPEGKLNISGMGAADATALRIDSQDTYKRDILFTEFNTTAYGGILRYDGGADLLQLLTLENGVEMQGISIRRQTGNVGIGTVNPTNKLDVAGDVAITGDLKMAGGDSYIWTNGSGTGFTGIFDSANSRVLFYASESTGNVGVGTTTPTSKLTVAGDIRQTACSAGKVLVYNNFCYDNVDRAAAPIASAQITCLQAGGHLCDEGELNAVCTSLGMAAITIGTWINNSSTGDDLFKVTNNMACTNLDGPAIDGRGNSRVFRCCYGVH
ncbi:MAG: hypothetical protein NDI69_15650 [Bacteriovoracaceae bacterium]|nr:hypothetical protein [Bacteriovoracaceae bacterium]